LPIFPVGFGVGTLKTLGALVIPAVGFDVGDADGPGVVGVPDGAGVGAYVGAVVVAGLTVGE
jgi:hypothetical protein